MKGKVKWEERNGQNNVENTHYWTWIHNWKWIEWHSPPGNSMQQTVDFVTTSLSELNEKSRWWWKSVTGVERDERSRSWGKKQQDTRKEGKELTKSWSGKVKRTCISCGERNRNESDTWPLPYHLLTSFSAFNICRTRNKNHTCNELNSSFQMHNNNQA